MAAPRPAADPVDPHYGIPVSYVRRYEANTDALNKYLEQHPEVARQIDTASDAEAGRLIVHLLDGLKLH
jgi:hypothetical protein